MYSKEQDEKPTNLTTACVTPNHTKARELEKEVLKQLALGHSEAMNYLFDNYYQMLCARAYNYIKEYDKAEDLVQDVLLNIWKKRTSLNIEVSLKAYLYRCVTNRALNYIRDNKSRYVELDAHFEDQSHSVEEAMYYNETEERVFYYINALSPKCKEVFLLSRMENMKYKEIAVALDISAKTVEHHIARALAFLRENLSDVRELAYC